MSGLRIEGETDGLSDRQISFIRGILEKQGYNNSKVTIVTDSYSNVIRITVEDFKTTAIFAPKSQEENTELFNHEITTYDNVLLKLINLQIAGNIPKKNLLTHANLKCYGVLEAPEISLYEELNELEMAEINDFSSLSNDSVLLILKNFYILNCLASALQKINYELFDRFKSKLFEMWNENEGELNTTKLENCVANDTASVEDNYKSVLKAKISQGTYYFAESWNETERLFRELLDKKGDLRNNLFEQRNWMVLEGKLVSLQLHIRAMIEILPERLSHFRQRLDCFKRCRMIDALIAEVAVLNKFLVPASKHLELQIDLLIQEFDEYEMSRRKTMLLLYGLETKTIGVAQAVLNLAERMGVSLNCEAIKTRRTTEKYNPVLVEFTRADRMKFWSARRLADDGIAIFEYLTKRRQDIYDEAHKRISGVWTDNGVVTLTVDDTDYALTSLEELNKVMGLINAKRVKGKSRQRGPKKLGNELATMAGGSLLNVQDTDEM